MRWCATVTITASRFVTCKILTHWEPTIVSRNSHDGSGTISCKYIVADPYRNRFSSEWVDSICTTEYACYFSISYTLTLCTFLCSVKISVNFCLLFSSSKLCYKFTLRSKNHEGNSEHSISTSCEYCEFNITIFNFELNLCTLICFGGIGINGHVAFNEADPTLTPEEFSALPTRT